MKGALINQTKMEEPIILTELREQLKTQVSRVRGTRQAFLKPNKMKVLRVEQQDAYKAFEAIRRRYDFDLMDTSSFTFKDHKEANCAYIRIRKAGVRVTMSGVELKNAEPC